MAKHAVGPGKLKRIVGFLLGAAVSIGALVILLRSPKLSRQLVHRRLTLAQPIEDPNPRRLRRAVWGVPPDAHSSNTFASLDRLIAAGPLYASLIDLLQ